ncbi:hypothetical protein [Kitasatospora sp. NPDC001175]|uniref:hypothetical protein n=1 Tax=Kitasatospora sp. NPDC001175 TaxID=3157103 RepID=UPI003D00E193
MAVSTPSERSMLASFITDVTPDLADELEQAAQEFLREHGIAEPITWQPLSLLRFDGHRWCGGQAARTVSYSAGLR